MDRECSVFFLSRVPEYRAGAPDRAHLCPGFELEELGELNVELSCDFEAPFEDVVLPLTEMVRAWCVARQIPLGASGDPELAVEVHALDMKLAEVQVVVCTIALNQTAIDVNDIDAVVGSELGQLEFVISCIFDLILSSRAIRDDVT